MWARSHENKAHVSYINSIRNLLFYSPSSKTNAPPDSGRALHYTDIKLHLECFAGITVPELKTFTIDRSIKSC